jgi:hypothetical protein
MTSDSNSAQNKPDFVAALEKAFGEPKQNAFGSSVFFVPATSQSVSLETQALSQYRFFTGELWDRFGEEKWMSTWLQVYVRDKNIGADILAELRGLSDREARQSAGLLLENQEDSQASEDALKNAFEQPTVQELRIFKIGDGEAMSGIAIAACMGNVGSLFLLLLLD